MTLELTDAVIKAAERVGSNGKDGLVGYLMRVGRKDSRAFGSLLRAVLPLRASVTIEEDRSTWTLDDYTAHFESRGIPMPFWFPAYLNGDLEQLAAHYEKELSLEVKLLPG